MRMNERARRSKQLLGAANPNPDPFLPIRPSLIAEFMMCTPFEVTLALDATAMVCEGGGLEEALEEYGKSEGRFDIAFNSKYSLNLKDTRNVVDKSDGSFYPHNWAIIYVWNARIERLFRHWSKIHSCIEDKSSGTGTDDQYTLFHAIRGFAKEQEGLKVGRLSNGFAAAYVEAEPGMGEDKRWRATQGEKLADI